MSKENQQITLPDGRRLGYNEYGPADGQPLFYFHGTPSARVEWDLFGSERLTRDFNLRVIAVDRPGMGLSTFQPGRRIGHWPADLCHLADHLGLNQFTILGYSGGSPYAAVCALKIPERLTRVDVVGVVGPFDKPELIAALPAGNRQFLFTSRDKPWLARSIQRMMKLAARLAPHQFVAQAVQVLPAVDQAVLLDAARQQGFRRMVLESMRQGPRGVQHDTALMVSPWDFAPAAIEMPVYLWKGAQDENAPLAMAYYLAEQIPHGHLTVYPEDGHLSIMVHHLETILSQLHAADIGIGSG